MSASKWSWGPFTFEGQLCSKSNSRRIVKFGNRLASIKSAESLDFVERFVALVPKPKEPYAGDMTMHVWAYYKDRRRDLDVALLQDSLQKARVIQNDRSIVEIHAYRLLDKENPRVVFKLEAK